MMPKLQECLDWLARPTWVCLISMAITAGGILVAATVVDDTTLFHLFSNERTRDEYLFERVKRMMSEPVGDHRVRVAVIGGSTTRLSLSSEGDLAAEIEKAGGGPAEVVSLVLNGQSMLESMALAELAASHGSRTVLIGANVHRLANPDRKNPFFRIGHVAPETRILLSNAFPYRKDNVKLSIVRTIDYANRHIYGEIRKGIIRFGIGQFFVVKRPGVKPPTTGGFAPHPPVTDRARLAAVMATERRFDKGVSLDEIVLEQIRGIVERHGARLVLMTTPANPDLIDPVRCPAFSRVYRINNQRLRALSRGTARPVILNDLVSYSRADFYDWGHLSNEQASKATTRAIARALVPVVKEVRPR